MPDILNKDMLALFMHIELFLDTLEHEVKSYKAPVIDLMAAQTKDPFRVLVATILSARTKDETTAAVCRRLFEKAPDLEHLSKMTEDELRDIIYPVGFFNNKARFLSQLPAALSRYDDRVPDTLEALLQLPGVGRKTANLVLSSAFNKPAICVDTHVHRIMNLWGYVQTCSPEQTEKALMKVLSQKYWSKVNSVLVVFGQHVCKPQWPACDRCILYDRCPVARDRRRVEKRV